VPIHLELDPTDRIATVTIDRTHRRNALNLEALEELHAAVVAALAGGARAIVLTGAEGHFCAGADLTELEDVSFTSRLADVLEHLAAAPVTTVAAIDGSCMGLGMQLAIACDVRVVGPAAKFAVPVAKLGLMVDHWTLDRVARTWGEGAARLMVLTATVLDADDAWRLGFAQKLGSLADAQALARQAAALAPLSQSGSKVGLDAHHDNHDEVARYEAAFARAWASDDLAEGRQAFSERRAPVFEGR
jgi:enoyl-CoA hydratase